LNALLVFCILPSKSILLYLSIPSSVKFSLHSVACSNFCCL
jgi:hypothetical protein